MTLSELIAGVEAHEKTLTVFNADTAVVSAVREQFADRNVTVRAESTASGKPAAFVTLSEDGEVRTATSVTDLQRRRDAQDGPIGLDESHARPILDRLDDTMFTSWDPAQMVAASREIEDRAWRVGAGTLYAGFQSLSTLRGELPAYERLGSKNITIHAFASPDAEPPANRGFQLHVERADEIENSWFVVYDGDGVDENKCALLAEEREPRSFYGFWTYDPDTVDWIVDYLTAEYGVVE